MGGDSGGGGAGGSGESESELVGETIGGVAERGEGGGEDGEGVESGWELAAVDEVSGGDEEVT